MTMENAKDWIAHLKLQPHPEGGYYKETFRSNQTVFRKTGGDLKQACTSIYYLLEGNDFSGFHRLSSDEIWYFHKGIPSLIHVIDHEGKLGSFELSDTSTGSLSFAIEGGCWFAAETITSYGFSLVSCAVAPGFDFSEFEMAKKNDLQLLYPEHKEILNRLCRD
jgi:predicted cupin superfamily sugar epimerase